MTFTYETAGSTKTIYNSAANSNASWDDSKWRARALATRIKRVLEEYDMSDTIAGEKILMSLRPYA